MRKNICIAWVFRTNEQTTSKSERASKVLTVLRTTVDRLQFRGRSSDTLGKAGGRQQIELGLDCYEYAAIAFHTMMHTLGYEHLHQWKDHNQYININMYNIDPKLL